ncbi:MAG: PorV/PorQ family protein [Candidatus Krumholzibacteria bacterium]|nr:PorV/PorQ family protein [Candidatus Krumholzibacteria bacterium]
MKRIVLTIFVFLVVLTVPGIVRSQDGTGGTRSIFTLGAGSRAISMGGCFVAIGDDPSVIYYNPAALKLNPYPAIMGNHIQLFSGFADASYDFIGLAWPTLSLGAFGLGLMNVGTGGIREFDSYSVETGEISYRETQMILSYAFDLPWQKFGRFSLGTSVKILNQRIGDYSDTGTGLDIGLLYHQDMVEGLVFGCNIQDIVGAETKLVTIPDKVDRTIMIGVGYNKRFENGSSMNLSVQMDMPERDDNDLRFGAEYNYREYISFRAGFDSESVTAGVGFTWNRYSGDYGFFSREEAGSSHPFSVQARIGDSLEDKKRIEEERRLKDEERRIAEIFASRVAEHIKVAQSNIDDEEFEGALDELKIALEYDPESKRAAEMMSSVESRIVEIQAEKTRTAEKSLLINQHFSLGLRYYSENEYILSRAQWKIVLEMDPDNNDAADYLARTEGKLEEQITQHKTAAGGYESRGRLAAALGEWNIVRMIDPSNSEAIAATERISTRMEELGRNYKAANRRLQTIESFENALKAFSEGRYDDSANLLEEVLRRQPDHEEARDLLNRIRRRMTPLTEEQKEEVRQLYIQGMRHFTQKDYLQAIAVWNRIIEIDPDNESVRRNIEEAQQRIDKLK